MHHNWICAIYIYIRVMPPSKSIVFTSIRVKSLLINESRSFDQSIDYSPAHTEDPLWHFVLIWLQATQDTLRFMNGFHDIQLIIILIEIILMLSLNSFLCRPRNEEMVDAPSTDADMSWMSTAPTADVVFQRIKQLRSLSLETLSRLLPSEISTRLAPTRPTPCQNCTTNCTTVCHVLSTARLLETDQRKPEESVRHHSVRSPQ